MGAKWNRRVNRRVDTTHRPIVDGLRQAGIQVYEVGEPCDIFCYFWCARHNQHCWAPLELKTPYGKKDTKAVVDKRQVKQIEFLEKTNTPRVTSITEALLALSLHGITAREALRSSP